MLSALLTKKPPLDEASATWIFDTFAWALRNFDARVFHQDSILVVPSNEHFPGRADTPHGMAELMFFRVAEYAGMAHWPLRLVDHNTCELPAAPQVRIEGALRGARGVAQPAPIDPSRAISVQYSPTSIGNPEALIATFAHTLAHHLGRTAQEPPPGGAENWPHITELLAVFMGFGLMFANSAFNVRTGCGSCGSAEQRQNFLSQYHVTYALALFCELKAIPVGEGTRHLKKSLRSFFRRSLRDIRQREKALRALKAID